MINLPKKRLGGTDLETSIIGLGTVKFGRNTDVKYQENFSIPDDNAVLNLLSLAYDLGINLLDTAPAYGNSEERLGKLLHGQRDKWIITSKAGEEYINNTSVYNFTPKHLMFSIERSLRYLRTDYIDIFMIHSDGNDEQIINDYEVFATLDQAKKEGKIRYSGMSSKTVNGGLLTVKHSDVAMIAYNLQDTSQLPVLEAAQAANKSIFIKKALNSGHLAAKDSAVSLSEAIKFIYEQPAVSSIIFGTINTKHLQANAECALACMK